MAQNVLHVQERQLAADGTLRKSIINIPKIWAQVNRKNATVTDAKGYLKTYICKVEVISTDVLSYLYTAPENWVLKNGVRKWHIARNDQRAEMFGARAPKSTYGKTMRPLLHSGHQTDTEEGDFHELSAINQAGAIAGGDWTYSRMANSVGSLNMDSSTSISQEELADAYTLCLAGSSVLETGHTTSNHNKWSYVSIMESYLLARRNFTGGSQDGAIDSDVTPTPSPLVELMGDSLASVEIAKILDAEMEEKPPYAVQNSGGGAPGDAKNLVYQGALRTTSTYGRDSAIIRVPGGLMECWTKTEFAAGQTTGTRLPIWNIEVLGVVPAEG